MFWGIALILIGGFFFLQNTGYISGVSFDVVWPLLLVALGVSALLKRDCWCGIHWHTDARKRSDEK